MKLIPYLFAFICLILFGSCMNDSSRTSSEATAPSTNNAAQETANPGNTTQQPAANTAGLINPEHGKPGHRCDIPVGAPLNSAPNPTQNISTSVPPNTSAPTPSLLPPLPLTNTGTGLNPAHGQPGHRCDIPVGAPLASKPKQ